MANAELVAVVRSVTETNADGFSLPEGQSADDLKAFALQAKQHGVRPVFSIGGWSGSRYYSDLVATAASRSKFAKQIAAFMDKHGYVGVDLDWEYPNAEGIGCNKRRPEDAANLLAFLKTLRSVLGHEKVITAAVSTEGFLGPDGQPLSDFSDYGKYLDYINLMTSGTSVETAVKRWTSRGFPASKILLGIPSYAISFTTKSSSLSTSVIRGGKWHSQAYQAWTGVVPQGPPSDSNQRTTDECGNVSAGYSGQWRYCELVANGLLQSNGRSGANGFVRHWDDCSLAPFLFHSEKRHYISYEDSKSVAIKAKWAMKQGLGGVFVFDSTGFDSNVYDSITSALYARRSRK
ncbi:hypothetical protein JCM8202v2_002402 [Rhodotorula sphaerocarpa]